MQFIDPTPPLPKVRPEPKPMIKSVAKLRPKQKMLPPPPLEEMELAVPKPFRKKKRLVAQTPLSELQIPMMKKKNTA